MEENKATNFLYEIIESDLKSGKVKEIRTRFPPEPNGYLHIGSAKAIYINYMAAKKYGGRFNLRYDDTNPSKEDDEFVQSIYEDLVWLIGEEPDAVCYGSDYFDKCYEYAVKLIKDGKAYVCNLSPEEMREYRGTLTEPGRESPYRNRSVEENLELFERMKNGEFPDGYCTLRAKIDMASPNMNMRDPAIYRILHKEHHRQGNKWCIYPLYDFAHPIQDAIEGITHSMCSIEFENHRPLYDWVIDNIGVEHKPHQYEFARLNVTNTVMSKRYLRQLVETGVVDGWDDPRMPTLRALRRRGYTPEAIFDFVERAGVAKTYSIVDYALLEHCIREELNRTALRRIAVLDPIKVIVENYPEGKTEYFEIANNPNDESAGKRKVAFTREIYIDSEDFSLNPPPKYFRLKPDGEVRLMGAYIIKYKDVVRNEDGSIREIICTADLESGCGNPVDGRKIKGTIHWVSASDCIEADVYVYDKLFNIENTNAIAENETYDDYLNKDSVKIYKNCKLEKALADAKPSEKFQFVRKGYFCKDTKRENTFNQIVELKDSKPF
ncbi:MAG TPA: glutamine--tRNA ligase/YqeY domain fusion protein [Bacillota bacterium]|nr:glutamine--tRNA ligase/YqeY domain fusion protein [Bacillota bacterium]HOK67999.1 glutamine--tRNA ligase/YqeY domain fusion protein [Bacillota bacterium]HPP84545.1 glutamine--tRNA ligase/YqeY domain fusion protein [Bacillota bacterium]